MKRKIVYVVNPVAGTKSKDDLQRWLEKKMKAASVDYIIMHSHADGDYSQLQTVIRKQHVTDVVVCGGDGTLSAVAAALIGTEVNIGIIPVGSGNGLARAAGIPLKPSKALDIIIAQHVVEIDGFYINREFSCMLSGLGFDAQIAHNFAKNSRRGLITYTRESLMHFFKAKPYQFEIILPDFSFYTDAFFISIANSNQFGNNFTIAPKASLTDGLLDIVVVQKMSKARLPFAILKQIRGNNTLQELVDTISKRNVVYFQVPEIKIRNVQYAPLHIDGDPKDSSEEFDIRVVPKAIRLLMPA
ncbi:MAG: diacylglycerol kinase family protein [Chitinophagaceae bacterium]